MAENFLTVSAGIKTFVNGTKVMAGDLSFATGLTNGADIKVGIATAASQAVINSAGTYGTAASVKSAAFGATSSVFDSAGGTMTITAGSNDALVITVATGSTVAQIKDAINATTGTSGVSASLEATTNKLVISTSSSFGASASVNLAYSAGSTIISSGTTSGTNGTFATAAGFYVCKRNKD